MYNSRNPTSSNYTDSNVGENVTSFQSMNILLGNLYKPRCADGNKLVLREVSWCHKPTGIFRSVQYNIMYFHQCFIIAFSVIALIEAQHQTPRLRRQHDRDRLVLSDFQDIHEQIVTSRATGVDFRPGKLPFRGKLIITDGGHPDFRKTTIKEEEIILTREWNLFKTLYNKTYHTVEDENFRREVFIENRRKIIKFNQDYSFGLSRFVMKINPSADLLTHEYNNIYNGYARPPKNRDRPNNQVPSTYISSLNVLLPESFDWKALGGVTPVKNQGKCGACFAFSATGSLEGHHFRKSGSLEELSPQNLIDCTRDYSNLGCDGGYVDESFNYVKNNPGIDKLVAYPYEAQDGPCRFDRSNIGANVTGYVELPIGDEQALATAVATLGPVSVAIDASRATFQFYSDGVYYDEECKNDADNVNHAVLVVGYGVEPDGTKYWLVKNSYGPEWGNGGYIKMARDAGNHCGIATSAFYPLV